MRRIYRLVVCGQMAIARAAMQQHCEREAHTDECTTDDCASFHCRLSFPSTAAAAARMCSQDAFAWSQISDLACQCDVALGA